MARFKKGSQEAKDYMASIRAKKKGGRGFMSDIGGIAGTALGARFGPVGSEIGNALGKLAGDKLQDKFNQRNERKVPVIKGGGKRRKGGALMAP
jgi:phage tail tape-measure protein